MTALLPWWWRWAALAALLAAACATTWLKTAEHYQGRLETIYAAGRVQALRTNQIEIQQAEVTKNVAKQTRSALAASDAYFAGLRIKPDSGKLPGPAAAAGGTQPAATPDRANSARCNDADGAADAITLLGLQRFYAEIRAAGTDGK